MQGEQCNVVPDTIDDIVADIGQEEKEEGTVNAHTHTFPRKTPNKIQWILDGAFK